MPAGWISQAEAIKLVMRAWRVDGEKARDVLILMIEQADPYLCDRRPDGWIYHEVKLRRVIAEMAGAYGPGRPGWGPRLEWLFTSAFGDDLPAKASHEVLVKIRRLALDNFGAAPSDVVVRKALSRFRAGQN